MLKRFFSVFIALLLVFNVSSTSFVMTASADSVTVPLVEQALTAEEMVVALSYLSASAYASCVWQAAIPAVAYLSLYGIKGDVNYTDETLNTLGSYVLNNYDELGSYTQIYLSSIVDYASTNVEVDVEDIRVYLSQGTIYGLNGIMSDIVSEGAILSNTALATANNSPSSSVMATMPVDYYDAFSSGTSFWFGIPDYTYSTYDSWTKYYMSQLKTSSGYFADYCVYSSTYKEFAFFSSIDNTMVTTIVDFSGSTALYVTAYESGTTSWSVAGVSSFGVSEIDWYYPADSIEDIFSDFLSGDIALLTTTLPISDSDTLDDFLSDGVLTSLKYPLDLDLEGVLDSPLVLADDDILVNPSDVVDVFTGTTAVEDVFPDTATSPDEPEPEPEPEEEEDEDSFTLVLPSYIDITSVWHYVVDMLILAFPFIALFTVVVSYIPDSLMTVIWGSLILAVLFGFVKRLLQ